MILLRNNKLILLTFFIIGFIIHYQSLQMVPYGDDWRFIYNYFTHEEVVANFSPFPGIFAYLAPYGPSALTIGFLYQVFGNHYFIYYLTPLIFKIFTSFIIFLILQNISLRLKKSNLFVNFLSATLFLVGTTGIQAIDWAFHINVYIALFIFSLGLLFQIRFYQTGGKLNLLAGLFLVLSSIVVAPFRFVPLVLMAPLLDIILVIRSNVKNMYQIVIWKNIVFALFILIFFEVGLFGHSPGDIYSPFPITESIKVVVVQPLSTIKTFLHWIGVSIIPAYPAGNPNSFIVGGIFLILVLVTLYKVRSRYIVWTSALFFVPLFLMWIITPLRIIDSGDKYLPLPFFALCLLIGILSLYSGKLKNTIKIAILGLVLIQAVSTIKIYSYWMAIGRGSDFILPVQEKIMSHFPTPLTEPKIIYLDFEDRAVQQSIEFGIGYRVAVLSQTRGLNNFPIPLSSKEDLTKFIRFETNRGEKMDQIVKKIYAFQYKNRQFEDITKSFDQELLTK